MVNVQHGTGISNHHTCICHSTRESYSSDRNQPDKINKRGRTHLRRSDVQSPNPLQRNLWRYTRRVHFCRATRWETSGWCYWFGSARQLRLGRSRSPKGVGCPLLHIPTRRHCFPRPSRSGLRVFWHELRVKRRVQKWQKSHQ